MAEILDLNGNVLNINNEIERSEPLKRSSHTIETKLPARSKRRNLCTSEDKCKKQEVLAQLVRTLWYGTRLNQVLNTKECFSSMSKEGHSLVLANNRLFHNSCNLPVIKVVQYLSIASYQRACESKRTRSTNMSNLNPVVCNENLVSIAIEDSIERKKAICEKKT